MKDSKRPTYVDSVHCGIRIAIWRSTSFGSLPYITRHFYGGDSTLVTWGPFWLEWPVLAKPQHGELL